MSSAPRAITLLAIEDICDAAGLTKGSFFHHFDSKEDLALAAAEYWGAVTGALFAAAPYRAPARSSRSPSGLRGFS